MCLIEVLEGITKYYGTAEHHNEPPFFFTSSEAINIARRFYTLLLNEAFSSCLFKLVIGTLPYLNYICKETNKVGNIINIKSAQNTHMLSSDRQYQTPNIVYFLFEHLNLCEKLQDIPFLYLLSVETAVLALRS